MSTNITLFSDDDIADRLKSGFSVSNDFRICERAENYSGCLASVSSGESQALILQVKLPVAYAQNLMCDLEMINCYPAVLLFELCQDGSIRYATTDPDTIPLSTPLADAFLSALSPFYACTLTHTRTTVWDDNIPAFAAFSGRQEAMREILRGCTERELDIHRRRYGLDLKGQGYHLFFWELRYIEYVEHRSFKDIHNYIGSVMQRECRQVISQYNGGEVFYATLVRVCVIINDMPIKSEAWRQLRFEEMLSRLCAVTGAKKATRYLSQRVASASDFRKEYERYLKDKSKIFFMHEAIVMRSSVLLRSPAPPDASELNELLDKISSYIRYDISSSELDAALKKLFFELLKPAMDFPSYYYSISIISRDLAKAGAPLGSSLNEKLNPNLLQFSYIEEQYGDILSMIGSLRSQSPCRRQTKSSLVMKAIEYIGLNYRENLTVADIARALYVSPTHLSQTFKNMLGVSPIQYLINYRIDRSKALLEETDHMVYTVADMVGFRDVRHFSKSFHKSVGISPTEYRRRLSQKS